MMTYRHDRALPRDTLFCKTIQTTRGQTLKTFLLPFLCLALVPVSTGATAQMVPVSPGTITGAPQSATALPVAGLSKVDSDYRLGVADKVRIIVFDEPTLSGEFLVNANGSLSMPLIGDVPVAGLTASVVTESIRKLLADGFLKDPQVSIDILTFRPFYILGEVNKPGEYRYSSGLTVFNAVATAEGFTYRANKKKVVIKHAGETEETKQKLTPNLQVRPGDTIRIQERLF
jgi:protein involved in polysaccharide export with SLBB domain